MTRIIDSSYPVSADWHHSTERQQYW